MGDKNEDTMLSWYIYTEKSTEDKRDQHLYDKMKLGRGRLTLKTECMNNKKCFKTIWEGKKECSNNINL